MLKKFYHPKLYIGIIVAALVVTGVYFWLCRLASEHAAEILKALRPICGAMLASVG